jgi:hypothetical protein
LSEDDLLAARVRAFQAGLLAPGGQQPRRAPEDAPRMPLDALKTRVKAVEARLAEAYQARRGKAQNE